MKTKISIELAHVTLHLDTIKVKGQRSTCRVGDMPTAHLVTIKLYIIVNGI